MRVMIVEDHPVNLKLATDILEIDGYEVWQCADAEIAQEQLKKELPDLILMDVALPGMDGLEFTRLLKADDKTNHINIIALTAFAMATDKDKAMEAGCNGYITKPINTRTFTKQILEIINKAL